jgi:transposase InsO family protein
MPNYQHLNQACSTRPLHVVQVVVALRMLLGWCGQRIAAELEHREIASISHMSVYRLFRRYHVQTRTYHPKGKSAGIRYRRQQVHAPNWTWHLDFGGPWTDARGIRHSILVVIDSYSRMLLALEIISEQSSEAAEAVLARLFEQYGRPRVVITDNGRAFVPSRPGWAHRFGRFLAAHGIVHRRTRPYYPQTNGKAEAVIKTVERELFSKVSFGSDGCWLWSEVAAHRQQYVGWYNFYRAHGALGYEVPASRYAGVRLPKQGLEQLFGYGDGVELAVLPEITSQTRVERLSLMPLN